MHNKNAIRFEHCGLALPRDTGQYFVAGPYSMRTGCRKVLSDTKDAPHINFGGNRQNIEKGMREVWEADPGHLFVQPDQAGAEALIVSYLCRPGKYRRLFELGIKPHTYLGFKLFLPAWHEHFTDYEINECTQADIDELAVSKTWKNIAAVVKDSDNWPSNKRFYHMGKKTIHAGSYGMKAPTFRTQILKESGGTIVLEHKEAARLLLGFHSEFPEIQEWHIRTRSMLHKKGELRNLFDFPYFVTTTIKDDDIKDFISWIPQSTVACITRQAVVNFQDYVESSKPHWHFLGDTHDSYVAEAPGTISADGATVSGEALECGKIMKSFLEIELVSPYDGVRFRMKSECSIGANWAPRKEKKDGTIINPLGLREVKV